MQGPTPPVKPTPPTPPVIGGKENVEAKPLESPAPKSESGAEKQAIVPQKQQPVKAVRETPGAAQKDKAAESPVKNLPQANYQAETGTKSEQPPNTTPAEKTTPTGDFGGMLAAILLAVSLISIVVYRFRFAGRSAKKTAPDLRSAEKKPEGKMAADDALQMIAALQQTKQTAKESALTETEATPKTQTGDNKAKQSTSTFDFRV